MCNIYVYMYVYMLYMYMLHICIHCTHFKQLCIIYYAISISYDQLCLLFARTGLVINLYEEKHPPPLFEGRASL